MSCLGTPASRGRPRPQTRASSPLQECALPRPGGPSPPPSAPLTFCACQGHLIGQRQGTGIDPISQRRNEGSDSCLCGLSPHFINWRLKQADGGDEGGAKGGGEAGYGEETHLAKGQGLRKSDSSALSPDRRLGSNFYHLPGSQEPVFSPVGAGAAL